VDTGDVPLKETVEHYPFFSLLFHIWAQDQQASFAMYFCHDTLPTGPKATGPTNHELET
jgi:hypothetical protein